MPLALGLTYGKKKLKPKFFGSGRHQHKRRHTHTMAVSYNNIGALTQVDLVKNYAPDHKYYGVYDYTRLIDGVAIDYTPLGLIHRGSKGMARIVIPINADKAETLCSDTKLARADVRAGILQSVKHEQRARDVRNRLKAKLEARKGGEGGQ